MPSPALMAHAMPGHQAWHTQDRLAARQPTNGAAGSLRAEEEEEEAEDCDEGECDGDGWW